MAVAVALLVAFVFVNGVRAVAWVSIVKDVLMVLAALAIGIGVPLIHFGGIGADVYRAGARAPGAPHDARSHPNLGHAWYISTVLLTSLGLYMWPHSFAASFTARSADTLRRNAVVMPLYTLTLAFMFFAGFAAVLVVPGLPNGDLALLTVVRQSFPPWFLGSSVGGAGALTAMVPAAIFILTAATLFAKNLYPAAVCSCYERCTGGTAGARMVVVLGLHQPCLALCQLTDAGVAAADGLRGRVAVLSRGRAGPLLAARQRAWGVCRPRRRGGRRGRSHARALRSDIRSERRLPGVVSELPHRRVREPADTGS